MLSRNLPKRVSYYQGMMDLDVLDPGDKYDKLKDGAHKIFLCAGGVMDDCSEKMKDFLDYVAGKNTTGELTNRLREEVERVKKSDRWRA